MTDTITLTGLVATVPRHLVTAEGLPITSFRLASTQRRYDRRAGVWVDGDTNWYTVSCFRQLAIHAATSIVKGDRVMASGRLRIRDWNSGERSGTTIEVEADALGHDLVWGNSTFTRTVTASVARAAERGDGEAAANPADSPVTAGQLTPPQASAVFDPDEAALSNAG